MKFIGEMNAKGADGAERGLDTSEYDTEIHADGSGRIRLGSSVPETRIEARVTAGVSSSWNQLEAALKHGIIRLAAHNYRERDQGAGGSPPASVAALWHPYRRLRL